MECWTFQRVVFRHPFTSKDLFGGSWLGSFLGEACFFRDPSHPKVNCNLSKPGSSEANRIARCPCCENANDLPKKNS